MISLTSVAASAPPRVGLTATNTLGGVLRLDDDCAEVGPCDLAEEVRHEIQERVVALIRAKGRMPRVCMYAPAPRRWVLWSFVEERGWRAERWYADGHPWSTGLVRAGWQRVRCEVGAGLADGVVVASRFDVSAGWGEFMEELAWFEAHIAFVVVVEVGRR